MVSKKRFLEPVRWLESSDRLFEDEITEDARLGCYVKREFNTDDEQRNASFVTALLAGVPGWQQGTADLPSSAVPIVNPNYLPAQTRTINHQNRGTGFRFFESVASAGGCDEEYTWLGVFFLHEEAVLTYEEAVNKERLAE